MAIYPKAKKKLIPKWNKVAMTRYRRMNLHVAVSESQSIYTMFSNSNSACSHFYVAKDGTVEQYIDTKYRSASDYHGNDSTISVETQGGVRNPEGEPWTQEQFDALVELWKWAMDTHKIKNQVAINTQTNENSSGLSWHRLGVEGNFSGRKGILATSYKPGGIRYSLARGKICPGDAKILQIPKIWEQANTDKVKPTTPSKPKPVEKPVSKPKPSTPSKPVKSDPKIKSVQEKLRLTGDYKGIIDGINGSMTKNAVKAYQRRQKIGKLVADGVWGLITEAHYQWVKSLQTKMNNWKGDKLIVDGDYGSVTAKRVLDLQKRNRGGAYKGYPDGVAGSIFLGMLGMSKYPN